MTDVLSEAQGGQSRRHTSTKPEDPKPVEKRCPGGRVSTVWSTAAPLHSHEIQNGGWPSPAPCHARRKKTLVCFLSLRCLKGEVQVWEEASAARELCQASDRSMCPFEASELRFVHLQERVTSAVLLVLHPIISGQMSPMQMSPGNPRPPLTLRGMPIHARETRTVSGFSECGHCCC